MSYMDIVFIPNDYHNIKNIPDDMIMEMMRIYHKNINGDILYKTNFFRNYERNIPRLWKKLIQTGIINSSDYGLYDDDEYLYKCPLIGSFKYLLCKMNFRLSFIYLGSSEYSMILNINNDDILNNNKWLVLKELLR